MAKHRSHRQLKRRGGAGTVQPQGMSTQAASSPSTSPSTARAATLAAAREAFPGAFAALVDGADMSVEYACGGTEDTPLVRRVVPYTFNASLFSEEEALCDRDELVAADMLLAIDMCIEVAADGFADAADRLLCIDMLFALLRHALGTVMLCPGNVQTRRRPHADADAHAHADAHAQEAASGQVTRLSNALMCAGTTAARFHDRVIRVRQLVGAIATTPGLHLKQFTKLLKDVWGDFSEVMDDLTCVEEAESAPGGDVAFVAGPESSDGAPGSGRHSDHAGARQARALLQQRAQALTNETLAGSQAWAVAQGCLNDGAGVEPGLDDGDDDGLGAGQTVLAGSDDEDAADGCSVDTSSSGGMASDSDDDDEEGVVSPRRNACVASAARRDDASADEDSDNAGSDADEAEEDERGRRGGGEVQSDWEEDDEDEL